MNQTFTRLIERIISGFSTNNIQFPDQQRTLLLTLISLIGITFLGFYSLLAFNQGHTKLALYKLILAIVITANLLDFRIRHKYKVNAAVGLFFLSVLFIYMYITNELNQYSFVWYLIFPPIACYLLGSAYGSLCSAIMIIFVFLYSTAAPSYNMMSRYSAYFIANVTGAYLLIAVLSCLFEKAWETRQKQLEDSLGDKTQKYRNIVDNISDLIFVHDLNGKIMETNLNFRHNVGYKNEELIGHNINEFIPDKFAYPFKDYLKRIKTHPRNTGKVVVKTKTGERRILGYLNIVDKDRDNKLKVHAFTKDITDRRLAEKRLEESEKWHRLLFEKAEDAIYVIDASPENMGRIVQANQSSAKMHGYEIKEIESLNIKDLRAPVDRDKFHSQLESIIQGEWKKIEIHHIKKDGTVFPVEANASLLEINRKKYILNIDRDISGRKKMKEKLRRSEKMEAIGVLAGGIAHDFNNILMPIIGHSEILMMDLKGNDPKRKNINNIYTSAMRAKNLVQQILTFSRQEKEEIKPMKIYPVVNEVVKLMKSAIPANIDITTQIDRNCPSVNANPTQIHRVLINMVTNAFHAIKPGNGKITIKLSSIQINSNNTPETKIKEGYYVCLEISDTGIGMDKDTCKKIFEPFFTTKKQGVGTGMGLSVVHGIVKNMNGKIIVTSRLRQGTSFKLYFPAIDKTPAEAGKITENTIQKGSGKILLIEDEPSIVSVEKEQLQLMGYQVKEFTDPALAVTAFKNMPEAFDLVITDLSMPKITGDQVISRIKQIRKDTPIILCTGHAHKDTIMPLETDVSIILKKPYTISELSKAIHTLLK